LVITARWLQNSLILSSWKHFRVMPKIKDKKAADLCLSSDCGTEEKKRKKKTYPKFLKGEAPEDEPVVSKGMSQTALQ